jgi:hypothetical protein
MRELLVVSSLGCPNGACEHLISDHDAEDYDGDGTPVNAVCRVEVCDCGAPAGRRPLTVSCPRCGQTYDLDLPESSSIDRALAEHECRCGADLLTGQPLDGDE